jgi:hypothetical protein
MFQLLDISRSFIDGDALYCGEANGIADGRLVWRTGAATRNVRLTGAGSAPHIHGFSYVRRTNVYAPQTIIHPQDEKMAIITGAGICRADATHFVEAAIPAVGARLYGGANGLMTVTAGANQAIGRCVRQDAVNNFVGTGTFTNQAVVEFFFTPLT